MSENIYSLIASYLEHQRDIGIQDIIFDSGSDIAKILAGRERIVKSTVSAANNRGNANAYPGAAAAVRTVTSTGRAVAARGGAGARQSKLDDLGDLDIKAFKKRAPEAAGQPAKANSVKRDKLTALYRDVIKCGKCPLSQSRTKVVFGTGCADGRLLIIGGAPTAQDGSAGLPFEGETGKLLDKIIVKMGLDKKLDVFITYMQKCNGDIGGNQANDNAGGVFNKEYAGVCRPIIDAQIDIIAPKAILILGQPGANFFLDNDIDIEFLRGMNHVYKDIPVIVTYDLSLMLSNPPLRHGAWEDMKRIRI